MDEPFNLVMHIRSQLAEACASKADYLFSGPVLARAGDASASDPMLPVFSGAGTAYYPDVEANGRPDPRVSYGFPGSSKSCEAIRESRTRKADIYRRVVSRQKKLWELKIARRKRRQKNLASAHRQDTVPADCGIENA